MPITRLLPCLLLATKPGAVADSSRSDVDDATVRLLLFENDARVPATLPANRC